MDDDASVDVLADQESMVKATTASIVNLSRYALAAEPQCTFSEWSRLPQQAGFLRIFSTISVLTVLVVIVVLGNALVIAAVLLRRRLRSATGLLILSLGVADLLVGTVILPFSIANEVLAGYWIFGETWCTMWLTMDIWMCTASIYNLVAISIDRYIAIIKPLNYPMLVTKFRARCIVAFVWVLSFLICSPSFMLASSYKPKSANRLDDCKCTPSHAGSVYIIFSASSSFYLPMIVVVFVYVRIYIAARNATKSIYSGMMQVSANANKNAKSYLMNNPSALGGNREAVPMLRVHRGSSIAHTHTPKPDHRRCNNGNTIRYPSYDGGSTRPTQLVQRDEGNATILTNDKEAPPPLSVTLNNAKKGVVPTMRVICEKDDMQSPDADSGTPISSPTKNQCLDSGNGNTAPWNLPTAKRHWLDKSPIKNGPIGRLLKKAPKKKAGCAYEKRLSLEIKAAKTVAIVTGCFIFCWLGFALLYGFSIETSPVVWSILFWLGYLNSALNPVIYTVFNREFRICFKRLLTCHRVNHSTHKATQYTNNNNSYNSTLRLTATAPAAGQKSNNVSTGPPTSPSPAHVYQYEQSATVKRGSHPTLNTLNTAPTSTTNESST